MKNVLVMILAGGEGRRLYPLTKDRAKPAVPFGGKYRIIDFVLNNFINSGFYKINVLTQFKSDSLNKHIARGWPMSPNYGHYMDLIPAQMRIDQHWYQGTADAIYQNLNIINDEMPDLVCIFGGDHIYKMDVQQMVDYHRLKNADLTVAALPVPVSEASAFGVIEVDKEFRVVGWEEKPQHPKEIPGQPGYSLCSLGNYVFDRGTLVSELMADAACDESNHDFGKDIIRSMYPRQNVYVYNFMQNYIPGSQPQEQGYWRDVGDIDSYWEANMDLVSVTPHFSLYNREWPIHTYSYISPPTKFVHDQEDRRGYATESIVSDGCIISGGRIHRCVLSPFVRINSYAVVEESILMHGVNVGRYAKIRKAIIDKNVTIPSGIEIGFNPDEDRARGFYVSPGGITVVEKNALITADASTMANV